MEPVSFHPNERIITSIDPTIGALPVLPVVYPNGTPGLVSCWQLSPDEWAQVSKTGRVYLAVWGPVIAPVLVTAFLSDVVGESSEVLHADGEKPA